MVPPIEPRLPIAQARGKNIIKIPLLSYLAIEDITTLLFMLANKNNPKPYKPKSFKKPLVIILFIIKIGKRLCKMRLTPLLPTILDLFQPFLAALRYCKASGFIRLNKNLLGRYYSSKSDG